MKSKIIAKRILDYKDGDILYYTVYDCGNENITHQKNTGMVSYKGHKLELYLERGNGALSRYYNTMEEIEQNEEFAQAKEVRI